MRSMRVWKGAHVTIEPRFTFSGSEVPGWPNTQFIATVVGKVGDFIKIKYPAGYTSLEDENKLCLVK